MSPEVDVARQEPSAWSAVKLRPDQYSETCDSQRWGLGPCPLACFFCAAEFFVKKIFEKEGACTPFVVYFCVVYRFRVFV